MRAPDSGPCPGDCVVTSISTARSFVPALLALVLSSHEALAQGTSFTYQGRLTDGGTPTNGNYDLQFALFDGSSGTTQIDSTQTVSNVSISAGIFTVQLDFGANAIPGVSRCLEISARLSGGGAFTLLTPRQQITSTPYATHSVSAASADTATAATSAATATNASQLGGVAAAN